METFLRLPETPESFKLHQLVRVATGIATRTDGTLVIDGHEMYFLTETGEYAVLAEVSLGKSATLDSFLYAGRDILSSGGEASRETIRAMDGVAFKFLVLPNDGNGYPLGRIVHVDALKKKNAFNVDIMNPVGLSGRSEIDKLETWFRYVARIDNGDRNYLAWQIAAAKMRDSYSTMEATLRVKRQAGAIEVKASKRQRALPVDDDEDLLASALGAPPDALAACRSNPAKSGRRFIGREPIKMVGAIGAMKKYAAYGKPLRPCRSYCIY